MQVLAGTSGFSYKEWRGHFYPEQLKEKQFLDYYSARLPSVEMNNTFYRLPRSNVLEAWASQVPDSFRFAIKASRRITHFGRLGDVADATSYLLDSLQVLGTRLGVVLFQLPPNMRRDDARLTQFLELLAGRVPAAFEFRHASWFEQPVFELLERHGAALVCGDPEEGGVEPPLLRTAEFVYIRLRRDSYSDSEIAVWAQRLKKLGGKRAFVYFKHELLGPEYAMQLSASIQNQS